MNLAFASATEIAGLVRARQVSVTEVVELYLDRITKLNSKINAVVHCASDAAREQARQLDRRLAAGEDVGPLAGVPMTVKDMFEVAGMPSTSGTLGRAHYQPERDATVVERLRAAGAVVLGKTNVSEFGLALEATNLVYGTTNNPYDLKRTPGGSSGGAAAAVAAGFSAIDIGSDGGGSIRIPAHFCGVAGLKPTNGRISRAGHFPLYSGLCSLLVGYGPIARRVSDLAIAFRALLGLDPRDPDVLPHIKEDAFDKPVRGLRVALHTDNGLRTPTPETVSAVERSAAVLERAGAIVTHARMPFLEEAFELHLALLVVDRGFLPLWMEAAGTKQIHPWVQAGWDWEEDAAKDFDSNTPTMLHDDWHNFRVEALRFLQQYDVLLSPIAPTPALAHEELSKAGNFNFSSYASLHNLTGCPAAVVRAGTSPEGLPINVQIVAKKFEDELVLRVAGVIEDALGGFVAPEEFS